MALRSADRYATPKAPAEDLERWAADEPVSAYRKLWRRRLARWERRDKTRVYSARPPRGGWALGEADLPIC
jgi:hypothetical protein